MTLVKLPLPLRSYAGGQAAVRVSASSVLQCILHLESSYPAIRERLRDEDGELSAAVNLYVNGEDVRHLLGIETPVAEADVLTIVVAIAGGAELVGQTGPAPNGG